MNATTARSAHGGESVLRRDAATNAKKTVERIARFHFFVLLRPAARGGSVSSSPPNDRLGKDAHACMPRERTSPAVVLRTCGSCGLVYKGMSIYVLTFARCLNNASHVLSFSLMNW
jgi:hypothetical protein